MRVKGQWAYLYRAMDEYGQVIDVFLRAHWDLDSAKAFLAQAIERRGVTPTEVITDSHQAYQWAVRDAAPEAVHVVTRRPATRRHRRSSAHLFQLRTGYARCAGCSRSPRGNSW